MRKLITCVAGGAEVDRHFAECSRVSDDPLVQLVIVSLFQGKPGLEPDRFSASHFQPLAERSEVVDTCVADECVEWGARENMGNSEHPSCLQAFIQPGVAVQSSCERDGGGKRCLQLFEVTGKYNLSPLECRIVWAVAFQFHQALPSMKTLPRTPLLRSTG